MGRLFSGLGVFLYRMTVVIFLLVTAVMITLYNAPIDVGSGALEQRASDAIGRTVTMGDDVELSFFPQFGFRVSELRVANAEGMTDPFFLEVDDATIRVKILPLFTGTVEVSEFILRKPVIHLERNRAGAVNWDLQSSNENDSQPSGTSSSTPNVSTAVRDLKLGDVRLEDGIITYKDNISDTDITLDTVNLDLNLPSLYKPTKLGGQFDYNDQPVVIDATITTLDDLRKGVPAKASFQAEFLDAVVQSNVDLTSTPAITYAGFLEATIPSVRRVADWLGAPIDVRYGFQQLNVSGQMSGDSSHISFTDAQILFDAIDGAGNFRADWGKKRPLLSGNLDLTTLDIRPYATPATPVSGFPPWSTQAIDFDALKAVDMDFSVTTEKLLIQNFDIDNSNLEVGLRSGVMKATLKNMILYNGTGTGAMTLDVSRRSPRVNATFKLANMNTRRFLKDATGLDRLEGVGDLTFTVSANGRSQLDLVSSLNGSGDYTVRDGSIIGIDLLKLLQSGARALTGGSADDRTAFTAFNSDFDIKNGTVITDNIALLSPLLRLTGEGTVNLPKQSQDICLDPRLVGDLSGQGGDKNRQGLGIKIRIAGTFNKPSIVPIICGNARSVVEDEVLKRLPIPGNDDGDVPKADDIIKRLPGFPGRG